MAKSCGGLSSRLARPHLPSSSQEQHYDISASPSLTLPPSPNYYHSELPSNESKKGKSTKGCRGRTLLRNSIANLKKGERYDIFFNEKDEPIEGPIIQLSYFIGIEAHTIPCTYETWRDVPDNEKEDLYRRVKEKFNFGGKECFEYVNEIAHRAWRREKKIIRDKLVTGKSLTDALANIPLGYNKKDWENISMTWTSTKYEKKCDANKHARTQPRMKHAMGSRSFVSVKARNALEREELFKKLYTPKVGGMSDATLKIMASVDMKTSDMPSTCTPEERTIARNNAIKEALDGKRKRKNNRKWVNEISNSSTSFESAINEMKIKWEKEKEILLLLLEEKEKEKRESERKMEERMKLFQSTIMNFVGYRPSLANGMESFVPETENESQNESQDFDLLEFDRD